jgi:hypothetical protein
MKKLFTRGAFAGVLASTAILATACPPPASSTPTNWSFQASQVTVNDSQDEVCVLVCVNREDEPYVLSVNFRVKLGVPGSAQTWVTGNRSDSQSGMGAGSTHAIANGSGASAKATFSNVVPLDVLDLADTNNHLEIMGSYVFALEEDTVGVGSAASGTADVLKDVLNDTIGSGTVPSDLTQLLGYITSNLGSAFGILGANIPLFGLGDDVMGGGLYVGLAVKGTLGDIINTSIGSTPFPNIAIPLVELPPDITHGGFYTTQASKTFNDQQWGAHGGTHTWNFTAGPA